MQNWQNNRSKAQTDSGNYLLALASVSSLPILPQPLGQAIKTLLTTLRHLRIVLAIRRIPHLVNQRFYLACNYHRFYVGRT